MAHDLTRNIKKINDIKKHPLEEADQNDLASNASEVYVRNHDRFVKISEAVTKTTASGNTITNSSTDSVGSGTVISKITYDPKFSKVTGTAPNLTITAADTGAKHDFVFKDGFSASGTGCFYQILDGVLYLNINRFEWQTAMTANTDYVMATLPEGIVIPTSFRVDTSVLPGTSSHLGGRVQLKTNREIVIHPYADVPAQTGDNVNATYGLFVVPTGKHFTTLEADI